jgi:hypothetical protein
MQKGIRLECGPSAEKGHPVPDMFVRETSS